MAKKPEVTWLQKRSAISGEMADQICCGDAGLELVTHAYANLTCPAQRIAYSLVVADPPAVDAVLAALGSVRRVVRAGESSSEQLRQSALNVQLPFENSVPML